MGGHHADALIETPRATFHPGTIELDPRRLPTWALAHPDASAKMAELATSFHPDRHAQVRAVLRWASDQGQALVVGPMDGDYDIQLPQVHLNLGLPMMGERFAPYGYLHLVLHDFTHHFLGQVHVEQADLASDRIDATRKRIHQAAMLGELTATFSTVSRIISDYSNWRAEAKGEGRPGQFGGFFSFARDERAVCRGWKAFYTGGRDYREFLEAEMRREVILDFRRAGDWLVWPSFAHLLGARGDRLRDALFRMEAALIPRVAPRLLTWAYWNRSVYSVADFQSGCRALVDRYTTPWHVAWQRDFDDGDPFETVIDRCRQTFRGLVLRDYGFFDRAPNDLGPHGYRCNVRRQQAKMLARKLYELRHEIERRGAATIFHGDAGHARAWTNAIDAVAAICRRLWSELHTEDAIDRYEELVTARTGLIERWRRDRDRFALPEDRRDFLENPNRFLFDPGVRDANMKPKRHPTPVERAAARRRLVELIRGKPVDEQVRGWTREIFAEIDVDALFDEAERRGIPTVSRPRAPARPAADRVVS